MASKKFLELQTMSVESIGTELSQSMTDLNSMKFDHGAKGLETELRDRELKAMSAEDLAKRSKIRFRRK